MFNKSTHPIFEPLLWVVFAALAYYFSFNFEKEIEIYRFGASGWPRAIIVFIFLAAVFLYIKGDKKTGMGIESDEAAEDIDAGDKSLDKSLAYRARVIATLLLPLAYALLMEKIGFYTLTPFFIFALLLLAGERRIKVLIGMTIGIYAIFIFIFGRLLYINLPVGTMRPFYDFSNWLLVIIR